MRIVKNQSLRVLYGLSVSLGAWASSACGSTTDDDPGNGGATGGAAAADGSGGLDGGGGSSGGAPGSGGSGANAGSGASPGSSPTGNPVTGGPHWGGTGDGFRPLTAGCGPDTAAACGGACEKSGGDPEVEVLRPPATLCFSGEGDLTPTDPTVVIEQAIERLNGQQYVHIRITFDPAFVDNTYGEGSCCGWSEPRGHWFRDLTGSDHTELLVTDGSGAVAMHFKLDFVSASPDAECGHATLGALGGDGAMIQGDPAHLLAAATSLDRNLNGCGYCQSPACGPNGDCTIDSPATDDQFTPNPATPDWDYRQVYEVWIDMAAFGGNGFGQANITYTHASPSKGQDTIEVQPSPCPPEWATPYCPPNVILEGGNCHQGPSTGEPSPCPPNQQVYIATEGASTCTPIPFANYPNMAPCPDGYILDVATEGRYCLPVP